MSYPSVRRELNSYENGLKNHSPVYPPGQIRTKGHDCGISQKIFVPSKNGAISKQGIKNA
jgi:hypothetical protein